jgi:hypothetical protein
MGQQTGQPRRQIRLVENDRLIAGRNLPYRVSATCRDLLRFSCRINSTHSYGYPVNYAENKVPAVIPLRSVRYGDALEIFGCGSGPRELKTVSF